MPSSLPILPPAPLTRDTLLQYIAECGIEAVTVDHPPLFTVEDSRDLRPDLEGGHTKNLFLKDKKGRHFLLTAQEDTAVDLKNLHKLLGAQGRFSFGKPEQMLEFLGVTPGAVTAFGVLNDRDASVTFAIDARLMEHDKLNCHPLTNEATTTIGRDDLLTLAAHSGHAAMIVDLSEVPG